MPPTEEASGSHPKPLATKSPHILDLEDGLKKIAGTKVSLLEKNRKRRIVVEFADNSQFKNIIGRLKTMTRHASDSPNERVDI